MNYDGSGLMTLVDNLAGPLSLAVDFMGKVMNNRKNCIINVGLIMKFSFPDKIPIYYYLTTISQYYVFSINRDNVGNLLSSDSIMYWFERSSYFTNFLEWSDLNGDNRGRWSVHWSNRFLSLAVIGDYIYVAEWDQSEE